MHIVHIGLYYILINYFIYFIICHHHYLMLRTKHYELGGQHILFLLLLKSISQPARLRRPNGTTKCTLGY